MNSANRDVKTPIIALVGPTAIGKTSLSLQLAHDFNCEIVSVDSMQVYRYMDVGTAKIKPEEMCSIPHHLIDIVNPDENYDAARFVHDASQAIDEITGRGKLPLLTGGTGLYLKALTEGLFAGIPDDNEIKFSLQKRLKEEGSSKLHEELFACDPESAGRIHPNDSVRILRGLEIFQASGITWSAHLRLQAKTKKSKAPLNALQIALTCDRKQLYERINYRSQLMLREGLEGEVRNLLSLGYSRSLNSMNAIGYRHMLNYLDGTWTFDEMLELLQRDTRRYAKRQYTWFRGIKGIEWFEVDAAEEIRKRIADWLRQS